MGMGKILSLIAGIITIVATYLLSWVSVTLPPTFYAYGIGFIKNLPAMFTEAEALGILLGVPGFVFYIIAGIGIVFLLSGIFQLIGMKSRVIGLIGSIFVLLMGIMLLLGTLNIVINLDWVTNIFGDSAPIIDGIIPYDLPLGPASLGLYVLIAGGALGLIAGIMGPD
ncbi:MAG: hypothetical protein HWN79_13710 [Candidatus Lokiarchaeota archaeon]|nr:hypothetical protein [Candidatus Lokiarchaeota archaeon]